MANPLPKTLTLTVILSILLAFSSTIVATTNDYKLAVYWGQNRSEGSLRDACATGIYSYVSLSFLVISGSASDGGNLNLDGHCFDPIITCPLIGFDITYCQNKGIKVLLSLSGGVDKSTPAESANDLAKSIWNSYLGGWNIIRPLGQTGLDGVDIAVTRGPSAYYAALVKALKSYSTPTKQVYVSVSPKCNPTGNILLPAITAGAPDSVWVKFYNDLSCDFSANRSLTGLRVWFNWSGLVPPQSGAKLLAGQPASEQAAKSGFIPEENLQGLLWFLETVENFGGVALWNRNYDKGRGNFIYKEFNQSFLSNSGRLSSV